MDKCPVCKSTLYPQEGCQVCYNCGWSACDNN